MGKTKLALSKLLISESNFVPLQLLHLTKYKLPRIDESLLFPDYLVVTTAIVARGIGKTSPCTSI